MSREPIDASGNQPGGCLFAGDNRLAHRDIPTCPTGPNPLADSDRCYMHDERAPIVAARLAEIAQMRARRSEKLEVPLEPFAIWLRQRSGQLALPPDGRRYATREEGLTRLAKATGVDKSRLSRWMRPADPGGPKLRIRRTTVQAVLEADGTCTLEQFYPPVDTASGERPR